MFNLVGASNSLLGLISLFLFLFGLGLAIWALVDVVRSTEAQFAAAEQNRGLWLALTIGAVVLTITGIFTFVGFILALVYLLAIRPRVAPFRGQGPSGGW